MKNIEAIRRQLEVRFRRQKSTWLKAEYDGREFELIRLALGIPTTREAIGDVDAVFQWIKEWQQAPEVFHVVYQSIRRPGMGGTIEVPSYVEISSIKALCLAIDPSNKMGKRWERALSRLTEMQTAESVIEVFCQQWSAIWTMSDEEFQRLQSVFAWLCEHRPADCFIREVPVEGVDTKWLEKHREILAKLISAFIGEWVKPKDFDRYCGFREIPLFVRIKHAQVFVSGLKNRDLVQLPVEILNRTKPEAILIIENLQTGLSLNPPESIPVVMGMGFGIELLRNLSWIKEIPVFYMGDLDIHGLAILTKVREFAPQTKSLFMDLSTFERWEYLAVTDPTRGTSIDDELLNTEERRLLKRLRASKKRLEQERIPIAELGQLAFSLG